MENSNNNQVLTFKTKDNLEVVYSIQILKMLNALQNLNSNIVNLDIGSNEFKFIIQFCEHHNFIHPPQIIRPLQFNELRRCVSDQWDAEFINSFDYNQVTDLLQAADYLKCNSLIDLCYAKLAMFFRSKIKF